MIEEKYNVERTIEVLVDDMKNKEEYNKQYAEMSYHDLIREVKKRDSVLNDANKAIKDARRKNIRLNTLVRLLTSVGIGLVIIIFFIVGVANKRIEESKIYVSTDIDFDSMAYHTIEYIEPGAYLGYSRFGNGPIYLRISEDGTISIAVYEIHMYENGYAKLEDGPTILYTGTLKHASDMINGSYFRSDDTKDDKYALDIDSPYKLTIKSSFNNTDDNNYLDHPEYTDFWKVSD